MDRQEFKDRFRNAVERMNEADVLRKRDAQVACPKQPKVEMVTLGSLLDQWPKRKG